MAGAFFFIVAVVVGIIIIRHVVKKTKRRAAEWSLAAQSLGLDYIPSGVPFQSGTIQGECQGVWLNVTLHSESSGKSSTTFTRYVASFPDRLPLELRLTRQGYFHGVASFFGVQDIEVGDPEFDALVIIKGDDEDAVREFLDAERRREIAALYAEFERVSIDSCQIVAMAHGAAESHQILVDASELMVGAARGISGAGTAPAQEFVAQGSRVRFVSEEEIGEPDDLISEIRNSWAQGKSILGAPMMGIGSGRHEVFEPYDPPVPTWDSERPTDPGIGVEPVEPEPEEDEPEVVADETDEVDEVGEDEAFLRPTPELATTEPPETPQDVCPPPAAEPLEPTDTAAAFAGLSSAESAFAELEQSGFSENPVETAPEEPQSAPVNQAAGSNVFELCESLFGDDASGYEIDQRFASHRGERVAWSGVLGEASEFDLDFELGSGAGTRGVFKVHEVAGAFGTAEPIVAVVRFPEGYGERLAGMVGQRVAFEARLDKAKGLMKELVLLDGELTG